MNNDIFQSYKKALEYYTNKFIEAHKKEIEKVFAFVNKKMYHSTN